MKYQKSIQEIKEIPQNGYNVVSLFAGAGGSSMGYMLSGYKMKLVNDFDQHAYEAYHKNFPDTNYVVKSIRDLTGKEILEQIGLKKYELDILDGSPPCTVFSTTGAREKYWGVEKNYPGGGSQREDDLFFEYLRIVKETMPKVFIAENVKGMLVGNAKKYVEEVLKKADSIGYNAECRLLNAADFGTPQMRERTIFIGVRKDLDMMPVYPTPFDKQMTTEEAIGDLQHNGTDARPLTADMMHKCALIGPFAGGAKMDEIEKTTGVKFFRTKMRRDYWTKPSYTLTAEVRMLHPCEDRWLSVPEGLRLQSFPDDYIMDDSPAQNWKRIGRSVPPNLMAAISKTIQTEILDKLPEKSYNECEEYFSHIIDDYEVKIK